MQILQVLTIFKFSKKALYLALLWLMDYREQ